MIGITRFLRYASTSFFFQPSRNRPPFSNSVPHPSFKEGSTHELGADDTFPNSYMGAGKMYMFNAHILWPNFLASLECQ